MDIVVDIGGTNMRVAAVSADSLGEIKKVPTPKEPLEGIATLVRLVRECADDRDVSAFAGGIAADGISDSGTLSGARNLRAWEHIDFVGTLSKALGVPVRLENDVAVVGLGEASFGAGKGVASLAYVTVSTGVGAAVIRDGIIVATGNSTRMQVEGTDIEYLISGTAVTKKFGVHPKDLDSLEDRNKLADILAEGLRTLVEQWSPDTIVLGGSMIVGVNPIPIPRVQESLNKLLTQYPKPPVIKKAELGDNGGLWGGLALLKQTK